VPDVTLVAKRVAGLDLVGTEPVPRQTLALVRVAPLILVGTVAVTDIRAVGQADVARQAEERVGPVEVGYPTTKAGLSEARPTKRRGGEDDGVERDV